MVKGARRPRVKVHARPAVKSEDLSMTDAWHLKVGLRSGCSCSFYQPNQHQMALGFQQIVSHLLGGKVIHWE